jgi:hypothetical protein
VDKAATYKLQKDMGLEAILASVERFCLRTSNSRH